MELRRTREHVELLAVESQPPADGDRQRTDAALMFLEVGVALAECLQQHVAQLQHRTASARAVLARVQPLIGQLQYGGRIAALGGDAHLAVCGADRKAGTALGERRDAVEHQRIVGGRGIEQDAELVASHPVGGSVPGDAGAQLVAQPFQQGVARGVAEGVVVALEAV